MGKPTAARTALTLVLLALAGLPALGVVPAVRFARERIVVTVRPSSIAVDGLYEYENPWPVAATQGLSIPFATGDGQLAPATVDVALVEASGERPLVVAWVLGTPCFEVPVPARGVARVRVRFEQRATSGRATYLLTTTGPWGRPLERGEYVAREVGTRLVRSSLALGADLACVRESFLPSEDWSLAWTDDASSR